MDTRRALWNSQQNLLKSIMLLPAKFETAIKLCLEQHAMVHSSAMAPINTVTFEDELWDGLEETACRTISTVNAETIVWNLWHSTRIEDITMNILVTDDTQVINSGNWLSKMNLQVCDTGNAMTAAQIIDLSSRINIPELRNYRIAVGQKTRKIIQNLAPGDLRRTMTAGRLQRILNEGAVLKVAEANWLIDFWGRKNVAGILLMPVTRHQIVHLNETMRLKKLLLKPAR